MPLASNATMTFIGYEVGDAGLTLHFLCPNPGPGEASDWYVALSDADLSTVTTTASFKTLVLDRLKRKFRAQGLATKLDPYLGQSVTLP